MPEECLTREYGEVFREFRILNGYTLVQACDGCCDRKTLWNFENGETRICLEIFCQLLKNIKVPAMEFFSAVYNYQLTTNDLFTKKMYKYYRAGNTLGLKKMLEVKKASDPKVGKLKRNWDIFVLSGFIHNLDLTFIVTDEVIDLATEYLLGIERWATRDLRAFANTLYIFNINLICLIVNEIIKNENVDSTEFERRKYFINILINSSYVCTERKFLKEAKHFLDFAQKLLPEKQEYLFTDLLGECLAVKFAEGAYKFSSGEKGGRDQMMAIISSLSFFGQDNLVKIYQKYMDNLCA